MKYYSLNGNTQSVSFKEATIQGLAPDKGLYFPERITPLHTDIIKNIEAYTHHEIAFEAIKQFIGNVIPHEILETIVRDTLSFDFPLIEIEENIYALELFHGPTMAFKDVGARFMARCLGYFNEQDKKQNITVLVATSGDTGGAVADGFLNVPGVNVVILYPSGKVSDLQEKQLTTLGNNITAVEVNGNFDDCQDMVKTAFLDEGLKIKNLTSANSINVARWLPQLFYFFFAYKALKNKNKPLIFSVPSGNFGNICSGMVAKKLGLPISHFVAATNVNKTVVNYLDTGVYQPKKSIATISNAMDVGNPSNFVRIEQLTNNSLRTLKSVFSSYSFTDEETKNAMLNVYKNTSYICDPHGAVGYLGLQKHLTDKENINGIFLETAHPAKFIDTVEDTLKTPVALPSQLKVLKDRQKQSIRIDNNYEVLKEFLLSVH